MFQVSPGIQVSEFDLTTNVPAVSTTECGIAGVFSWGPVNKITLVTSETDLAAKFGRPSNFNAETWFVADSFLAYSNQLYVVRAANTANVFSAIANSGTANAALNSVPNEDALESKTFQSNTQFVARYPGDRGNSLRISVCTTANQFSSTIDLAANTLFQDPDNTRITVNVGSSVANIVFANTADLTGNTPMAYANGIASSINVGDYIEVGNSTIGKQYLKVSSVGAINIANTAGANSGVAWFNVTFNDIYKLSTNFSSNTFTRKWEYFNLVDVAPGQSQYVATYGNTSAKDEMHIVVTDEDGAFTGQQNSILEVYAAVSRATDAKKEDGTSIYYKNAINSVSKYIYAASDISNAVTANALNVATATATSPYTMSFVGGTSGSDEANVSIGTLASGYDLFKNSEDVDISLILTGKSRGGVNGEQLGNYIIDNLVEVRKDCLAFISPDKADVVNNSIDPEQKVVDFANSIRSSSYAVLDSGYKYMYDKFNDVYRWIPLNGDMAGLCVNTDNLRDPWYSPAGFNRGYVKNVIKLAFNPGQAQRDLLYKNRVNPVVTFKGVGTILYGDKTALTIDSAFGQINVRRLFIVLEKAISRAARAQLFELNDEFTRAQFKNMVEPFLRDVKGRKGIYDFKVVCDTTNNTGEVIDQKRFVGDIYVKPARAINFIRLNFVAVRTSAQFEEIVGAFNG